jgi:hypothetical protein
VLLDSSGHGESLYANGSYAAELEIGI